MGGSILIVDDDADIRDALDACLVVEGYEVHTAEHGKAALDMIEFGLRPSVILLDLMMPVMNGYEFLDECHRNPRCVGVPVIIVSANRGFNADDFKGVFSIMRKPLDIEPLCEAIKLAIAA